uniref:Uncharacterized protein n=1 Tax=Anguilla anguilla TaxID=7936 RepID=A0A0E9R7V2_ANGAN
MTSILPLFFCSVSVSMAMQGSRLYFFIHIAFTTFLMHLETTGLTSLQNKNTSRQYCVCSS